MNNKRTINVSAPANVMLMGEHAVLFGHLAIVCAVSQRIYVTLTPRQDKQIKIQSTLAHDSGSIEEIKNINNPKLAFVIASIKMVNPAQGFELNIRSEFTHTVGLGSSAAVTAACIYALLLHTHGRTTLNDVFDMGLQVIQTVQQQGSGSDLAASVFGGILRYSAKSKDVTPLLTTATYPKLDLYYCGYKTPTADVLNIVANHAKQFPAIYQAIYQNMHATTIAAEVAIKEQNWHNLGQLMNVYHGLMDALGVSDKKLSELVYKARKNTDVLGAKISGSGLGDCIITLSKPNAQTTTTDDAHISALISPQGVMLHD